MRRHRVGFEGAGIRQGTWTGNLGGEGGGDLKEEAFVVLPNSPPSPPPPLALLPRARIMPHQLLLSQTGWVDLASNQDDDGGVH